jgi:hypothetical protein
MIGDGDCVEIGGMKIGKGNRSQFKKNPPHRDLNPRPSSLQHSALKGFFIIIWFVRLLALRPLLAYCASLG